jgi:hypothetical protein
MVKECFGCFGISDDCLVCSARFGCREEFLNSTIRKIEELTDIISKKQFVIESARYYIKLNIRKFSPEQLECMFRDGVLTLPDIPAKSRTDYLKTVAEK